MSTDEVYGDLPLDRPIFSLRKRLRSTRAVLTVRRKQRRIFWSFLTTERMDSRSVSADVRITNGPYQFPEKLIPLMIVNALNDDPLPVYGKGENVRDWLYVEDHCRAIDLLIHNGRTGEVYNVGGHNEMRNLDIVRMICRELGKPEELITFVADRKGHDLRYAIDPAKIYRELGWCPERSLKRGSE